MSGRAVKSWASPVVARGARQEQFCTLLREMRMAAGLSQRELAERSGTTQSAIARLEGGRREPKLMTLEALVTALGSELLLHISPGGKP